MFRALLTFSLLALNSALVFANPTQAGEILYSNEVFVSLLEKYIVSDGLDYNAWR